MKPQIETIADPHGWRYTWPDAGLQIDVFPTAAGREAVEAELTVRALVGEAWGHLHGPVSVDLLRTNSRQFLGRYLRTRGRRAGIDWEGIVEQACALTVRAIRGGTVEAPVTQTLAALVRKQLPPLRHIIPDLITEGCWLLGGHPKTGKSWLLLDLGLAVAFGGAALAKIPVEQGRVLYIALEDGERRLQSRALDSLHDEAAPDLFEFRTTWNRLDAGGLEELEAWLVQRPDTSLVMIDTLAKIRGDTSRRAQNRLFDEDYQSIAGLQELAGRRRVGIVMNLHLRKGRGDEADPLQSLSGTMGLSAGADGIIVLDRKRYHNDAILSVSSRDLPRDRELGLWWDESLTSWVLMGDATDVRLSMQRKAIIDMLREVGEPQGPKDITAMVGLDYGAVRRLLPAMARAGQLRQTARGLYGVGDAEFTDARYPGNGATKSDQGDHNDHAINAHNAINGGDEGIKRSQRSPDRTDRIDRPDRFSLQFEQPPPSFPCRVCGLSTGTDLRSICVPCDMKGVAP